MAIIISYLETNSKETMGTTEKFLSVALSQRGFSSFGRIIRSQTI